MTYVLTLIADPSKTPLTEDHTRRASQTLADLGATVRPPLWLSPQRAADIPFDPTRPPRDISSGPTALNAAVRAALPDDICDGVDLAVLPTEGRRKGLLIADMDSTIVTGETLDELAERAGIGATVADITRRAMNGEIGFEGALKERVAMLKGQPTNLIDDVLSAMTIMPGAKTLVETMRAHGARCVLVSGGFSVFTGPVAEIVGFDAEYGNTLIMAGGVFTGTVGEPILGRDAKLATLHSECKARNLTTDSALAVGDGANDLAMLNAAGMGVAFRAKPSVRANAPVVIDHNDLTALLYLQGYSDAEIPAH